MGGKPSKNSGQAERIRETLVGLYIAAMVSVFLLFPGFGGYGEITRWKWLAFCGLTVLWLAVTLLLPLELALVGHDRSPSRRKKRLPPLPWFFVLGYWVCSALSTILSPDRQTAFWGGQRYDGLVTITLYCVLCLTLSALARPGPRLLWPAGIGASVCCGIALIQLGGGNPLGLYPAGMTYQDAGVRYSGSFLGTVGNVDILSAAFCCFIPLLLLPLLLGKGRRRLLLLLPIALCLSVFLGMRVAGGFLGLAGGLLLTVPALAKGRKRRLLSTFALVLLAAALLAALWAFGDRIGGTAAEASALLHGQAEDSFGSSRIYIWRKVWELVPERPWFGGGPDTLWLRTDAAFERYDEALGVLIRSEVDAAHNEYLNILVNQGLLSLLFYLALLLSAARNWFLRGPEDPVAAVCGSAAACYGIQAFFGISSPAAAPFFWIALAPLLRGGYDKHDDQAKGDRQ